MKRRIKVNHSFSRFRGVGTLLFVIALVQAMPAQQEVTKLQAPGRPVPGGFFGLHIHHLWKTTEWPDVTFGTWRLWDAHVTWALLEPKPGTYDFSLLDRYVEAAESHHIEVVLTLAGTPTWASARPGEIPVHEGGGKGPPGSAAEPLSETVWQDFVRTVGVRYKGKIHYYEIWNEPMFRPFYSGTVPTMVKMTRSAGTILKEVDPENRVLSPPVDGSPGGVQWLKEFLNQGGGDSVDIFGFHFYVPGPPELMVKRIDLFRSILAQYNQSEKPIWNTEAGWQMKTRDPQVAADYVARAFLIAWVAGIKRYIFYAWDNDTMGIMLTGPRGKMVEAYRKVSQWMDGARFSDCVVLSDGTWIEHLTLPNGHNAKIVWNTSGEKHLAREHTGSAVSYENLDGTITEIQSTTDIPISGAPILLMYKASDE